MTAVFAVLGLLLLGVLAYGAWIIMANAVETPDYRSVLAEGEFEVRDYPALTVAEVTRTGDRWSAVRQGFGPLAGYIFAREREGPKIAMTAPVTQTPETGGEWAVRFIMPSEHTLETLPRPAGADVRLEQLPAQRRVAIRFSGVATDDLISEKEAALRDWVDRRGIAVEPTPTYAYYNDPFTPGFLRRNEVLLDVATP